MGPPGLASFAQQAARVVTDLLFRTEEEEAAAKEAERKKKEAANKYAGACRACVLWWGVVCVCVGVVEGMTRLLDD